MRLQFPRPKSRAQSAFTHPLTADVRRHASHQAHDKTCPEGAYTALVIERHLPLYDPLLSVERPVHLSLSP